MPRNARLHLTKDTFAYSSSSCGFERRIEHPVLLCQILSGLRARKQGGRWLEAKSLRRECHPPRGAPRGKPQTEHKHRTRGGQNSGEKPEHPTPKAQGSKRKREPGNGGTRTNTFPPRRWIISISHQPPSIALWPPRQAAQPCPHPGEGCRGLTLKVMATSSKCSKFAQTSEKELLWKISTWLPARATSFPTHRTSQGAYLQIVSLKYQKGKYISFIVTEASYAKWVGAIRPRVRNDTRMQAVRGTAPTSPTSILLL